MTQLSLLHQWLDQSLATDDPSLATLAALSIKIGKLDVSEYRQGAVRHGKLQIPLYYVAEWMAENWWSLLYEPRKTEDSNSPEFLARHSLLGAQHGFALPHVSIIPYGRAVRVHAEPRDAPLAGVRFPVRATVDMTPEDLIPVLEGFVSECVARLESSGIRDTPLQRAWHQVSDTSPSEAAFCRLIGSMGLSPYEVDDDIGRDLDWVFDTFGERATRDFCFAASAEDIHGLRALAARLDDQIAGSVDASLAPLGGRDIPADNLYAPSWRRGTNTAERIRQVLAIDPSDPLGTDKLFERLNVPVGKGKPASAERISLLGVSGDLALTGAAYRSGEQFRVGLLHDKEEPRRFSAARAIYLTLASESDAKRLVTAAVTRDQQASRAFAAEIMVPAKFLREQSEDGKLPIDEAYGIAHARRASLEVVQRQASNNGIQISNSY